MPMISQVLVTNSNSVSLPKDRLSELQSHHSRFDISVASEGLVFKVSDCRSEREEALRNEPAKLSSP
jgi:hypothetical protein